MNTIGLPACPRGNSQTFNIVVNVNGSPLDITGYNFAFIANKRLDKTTTPPVFIQWAQIDPAPDGSTVFYIDGSLTGTLDPGAYYFNVDMQDLVGAVTTIMAGTWPITPVPGLMSGMP